MDPSFNPVEVVPSKTPFGLDQLRRSYKTELSADDAMLAAPLPGTVDEVHPFMFLTAISTPESAESATRVDLVYTGCVLYTWTGVEGDPFVPVLPDSKHEQGSDVQSATSSKLNSGLSLASPATVQFYAPSRVLTYFTFGAPGTTAADDPAEAPTVITLTISDTTYSPSGSIQNSVDQLFSAQIVATSQAVEIVPGQFWQNVARKTKVYVSWIFTPLAPGSYIYLSGWGINYFAGNSLAISSGGESGAITVDSVDVSGQITGYHTTSNTFTVAHNLLPASGGSGTGAKFNVVIVT
jgi:hypothetical protein